MFGTKRLETILVQQPVGGLGAEKMRDTRAPAPQAANIRTLQRALGAVHVATRPNGLLEPHDFRPDQVDARGPHDALLVRPHLETVVVHVGDAQKHVLLGVGGFEVVGMLPFRFFARYFHAVHVQAAVDLRETVGVVYQEWITRS